MNTVYHKLKTPEESDRWPIVSVVIPAYNAAKFLGDALESVLAQTYQRVEIIVVDDNSQDQTPEVVAAFAGKIIYIRKKDGGRGCGAPRNVGVCAASGEWIAFLDADDIWKPTFLEKTVETGLETGADVVFSDYLKLVSGKVEGPTNLENVGIKAKLSVLAPGRILHSPFELLLAFCNYIPASAVMVRKRPLLQVGLFDECFDSCEDLDLWLRLAPNHRFAVVDEVLMLRRMHTQNMVHNKWTMLCTEIEAYKKAERYAPGLLPTTRWRKLLRRKLTPMLREQAALCLQRGELLQARKSWAKDFRSSYSPRIAAYWLATFLPQAWVEALRKGKRRVLSPRHQRLPCSPGQ